MVINDSDGKKSNKLITVLIIALYWILYELISVLAFIPQVFKFLTNSNLSSPDALQKSLEDAMASFYFPWYLNVLHLAVFILIIFLSKLNHLTFFNFKKPSNKIVLFTIISSVILIIVSFSLEYLISILQPNFNTYNQQILDTMISKTSPITIFIMTVILAPITEEVMFRGFIMKGLFPKHQMMGFLICPILFTLVHMPTDFLSFLIYFIMACGLGFIYYKTERIEASIFAHFLNNLLAFF